MVVGAAVVVARSAAVSSCPQASVASTVSTYSVSGSNSTRYAAAGDESAASTPSRMARVTERSVVHMVLLPRAHALEGQCLDTYASSPFVRSIRWMSNSSPEPLRGFSSFCARITLCPSVRRVIMP